MWVSIDMHMSLQALFVASNITFFFCVCTGSAVVFAMPLSTRSVQAYIMQLIFISLWVDE